MSLFRYSPNRVLNGNGIADASSIYFYQSGSTVKIAIYSDTGCTTPISNPVVVSAGAEIPDIYYNYVGDVRVRIVSADGTVPYDVDPYPPTLPIDSLPITTDGTLSANSNALIPTQKAVKSYVDASISATERRSPSRFAQMLRSGAYKANNFGQGVVNIGDSISHCAYSGNLYTNHWAYLLARALKAETGNDRSIGEFPMEGHYNPIPELVSAPLFTPVFSGTDWGTRGSNPAPYDYPLGNQGPASGGIGSGGAELVNGHSYSSSVNGATITLTGPTLGRAVSFKYTRKPGGGSFTIKINGVVKATVNTAGTLTYNVDTPSVLLEDNGKGQCEVQITLTAAAPVEINSLINLRTDSINVTDPLGRVQVHNYAKVGRTLSDMTQDNIIRCCNSAMLIMSLGVNDWQGYSTDTDNAAFAAFRQRIDWLIYYAGVFRTPVVVQDFIWYASLESSRTRQELKRLAVETGGLYIPYPDQFFPSGAKPTQSPLELNDPMWLWADALHPNRRGHELIFSTLTKALGLTVTTRQQALQYWDWPFPIPISSAAVKNATPTYPSTLSSIVQRGEEYYIYLNLVPTGSELPHAGLFETVMSVAPPRWRGDEVVPFGHQTVPVLLNLNTGAGLSFIQIDATSSIYIFCNTAGQTALQGGVLIRKAV